MSWKGKTGGRVLLKSALVVTAFAGILQPEAWAQTGTAAGFDLSGICVTAFIAVFVILSLLAGVMQGIMSIFPGKESPAPATPSIATEPAAASIDAGRVVAITTALQARVPGARVTRIEEVR